LLFMKKRARQRGFGFTNWGGKRRGAGRKPKGERAGVSHAKRPRLAAGGKHMVAESNPRILERARSWLLSIGWRRHGLIDPRETPVAV
jgi:hypothetical protein